MDITTNKANRTLGFIRCNPGDCSKQVKVTAYTTMVRPTLEYSSPVWDPMPPPLRQKLEQVMEGCQVVFSVYTDRTPGCVTKMVKDLGWESLKHRRYISRLMMIFKIHHQIVEVSGATEVLQLNDTRTRGSHHFKQLTCAITSYRDSFFPHTISNWNRLPTQATDCTTIEAFRVSLGSL